ncbi:hypothetical protein [Lewinella sp. 4G2]|uniref:hypothetical protein n=1 Tax=Lewinella sp. 4G2 TaxID=1803372 RepID=UPI0007B48492|nr:hypothetical protein [Lewinella sp. 4G2]OAV42699.1 hypothetical protein A3850_015780 [Lewinella sp. 4G2]
MIKFIIKLGLVLVVGLVGYNYFFGDAEEKEQSREIVGKVKELGSDAWALLRSEKQKMDDGKYDDALDKLDNLYGELRGKAQDIKDSGALDRLQELSERRGELEELLRQEGDELSAEGKRKLDDLTQDTEVLMNEMEAKSKSAAPY